MQLKNNYAQTVEVSELIIYEKSMTVDEADCTFPVYGDGNITPGIMKTVDFDLWEQANEDCGLAANEGNKKSFVVKVVSSPITTEIENIASGEMTATIARIPPPTRNCGPSDCSPPCNMEGGTQYIGDLTCQGTVVGDDTGDCTCKQQEGPK